MAGSVTHVRIHQTLRVTPAMAAGVTTTLRSMDDVVKMIEGWETAQASATWYLRRYNGDARQ